MNTDVRIQSDMAVIKNGVVLNSDGGSNGDVRRHTPSDNNNHAPLISIDPAIESGLLLRVPDLPLSRGASSAESLTPASNQFLNLPGTGEPRRHSMQDCSSPGRHHHHRRHRDRKRSCPDVRGASSADRRRRGSRSPLPNTHGSSLAVAVPGESASVTPSSSRRSSASSLSRRSSRDSEGCPHSRRSSRADDGSRRSSKCDTSRRSSRATDDTGGHSSRRSSRSVADDERRCSEDRHRQHHHHHSHHPHRRESSLTGPETNYRKGSSLLPPDADCGSRRTSKVPALLVTDEETGQQSKPDEELDSPRRRIIIFVISSVACFILLMSVVLIAVTLTISPAIDSIGEYPSVVSAEVLRRFSQAGSVGHYSVVMAASSVRRVLWPERATGPRRMARSLLVRQVEATPGSADQENKAGDHGRRRTPKLKD
ncbi:uncharacterized protein LOC144095434 [Amblyomma americanum]